MTTAHRYPKTEPFNVEVRLSVEPKGFCLPMDQAYFGSLTPAVEGEARTATRRWHSHHDMYFPATLQELATLACQVEQEGAELGFEMPGENAAWQPLTYLSADEMSRGSGRPSREDRESHAWAAYLYRGKAMVSFHHGKYGLRLQTFETMSEALAALVALLHGQPWETFGDEDSQRTLMHKGQFYWDTPLDAKPIPVDNFEFEAQDGHSWNISGCGMASILLWTTPNGRRAHVWHEDHAESLDKLADILDGKLTPLDFREEDTEEPEFCLAPGNTLSAEEQAQHTAEFQAYRWIPETVAAVAQPVQGAVYVLSIFKRNDKHVVDSLVYLTRQGHKVHLAMTGKSWTVTARNLDSQEVASTFDVNDKSSAFRALAKALRGEAWR
jgi:hypothetical protein